VEGSESLYKESIGNRTAAFATMGAIGKNKKWLLVAHHLLQIFAQLIHLYLLANTLKAKLSGR